MCDQAIVGCIVQRAETQQPCIVPQSRCDERFALRLPGRAADSGDQHTLPTYCVLARDTRGECQHRLEQTNPGIADAKLRGVNADGDAARACRTIISGQSRLAPLVQSPVRIQGERMRGYHDAVEQPPTEVRTFHR
jgi:hypothetical protein